MDDLSSDQSIRKGSKSDIDKENKDLKPPTRACNPLPFSNFG